MQDNSGNVSGDMRSFSSTSSIKHGFVDADMATMKGYIQDLKSSLKINKELVQSLLFKQKPSKAINLLMPRTYFSPKSFESLFHENKRLDEEIDEIHNLTSEINTKNFLNEQIFGEWEMRHNELIDEYKEQLNELVFQDERKNRVIEDLTETNSVLIVDSEIARKSKHIIEIKPNSNILEMHFKVENIREYIQFRARDIYSYEIQRKNIVEASEKIRNEIQKIKALLKTPLNRKVNLEQAHEFINKECNVHQNVIPQLDLSLIEKKIRNSLTERNQSELENCVEIENDIETFKEEISKKTEKLVKISEKNLKIYNLNATLINENKKLVEKVETLYKSYYKPDLTMEIIDNYESVLPYRVKSGYLEEISEIEVNPTNFYEVSNED